MKPYNLWIAKVWTVPDLDTTRPIESLKIYIVSGTFKEAPGKVLNIIGTRHITKIEITPTEMELLL